MRALGTGQSTALAATTLTNTAATFRVPDPVTGELGVIGLALNPNTGQGQTFTVVANTATTLTVDGGDGDLTTVAAVGNPYVGVYTFDNLRVRNGGSLATADECDVPGTIETTGGSTSYGNLVQTGKLMVVPFTRFAMADAFPDAFIRSAPSRIATPERSDVR